MIDFRIKRLYLLGVGEPIDTLQYRVPQCYMGADGNIHIVHEQGKIQYEDWIDVPVVVGK